MNEVVVIFFLFCLQLSLQHILTPDNLHKDSRLLGGGGVKDDIEAYDCPCGCWIHSIQGSNNTEFLANDLRCINDSTSTSIGGHNVNCPCGCNIRTSKNTTAEIFPNAECNSSTLATIDGIKINCPCSCNGSTAFSTFYEIKASPKCDNGKVWTEMKLPNIDVSTIFNFPDDAANAIPVNNGQLSEKLTEFPEMVAAAINGDTNQLDPKEIDKSLHKVLAALSMIR